MSSGEGLHILLVEDNDDDVVEMQDVFSSSDLVRGYSRVADGEAAIAYLCGEAPFESVGRPDLIMLDLGLPKVDGFQVLDTIRKNPELRDIPVVVFTQSRNEQDVVQSYNLGACSFVSKPVGVERFEELVRGFSIYWDAVARMQEV